MSYGGWVLQECGFSRPDLSLRGAFAEAIDAPTREKLWGAALLIYGAREMTDPDEGFADFLSDMLGILAAERDALFALDCAKENL